MAPEGTDTVFGFGCGLDWRPTVFLDGIPSNRVCDACGLVPSLTALLSCRHVLCETCYDRCVCNKSMCCLDGSTIKCDEVVWTTFSADSVLRRKIQCWNASRGCDVSGPAYEIIDHFNRGCRHHGVSCPRCKRSIAHNEAVDHIKSGLCAPSTVDENRLGPNLEAAVVITANVLCQLDKKVCFLQTLLQDNFDSFSGCVKALQEGIRVCVPVPESIQLLGVMLQRTSKESEGSKSSAGGNVNATVQHSVQQLNRYIERLALSQRSAVECKGSKRSAASTNIIGAMKKSVAAAVTEWSANKGNLNKAEEPTRGDNDANRLPEKCLQRFCLEITQRLKFLELASKLSLNYKLSEAKTLEWYVESWSQLKENSRTGKEAVCYAEDGEYFYGYSILPGIELVTLDDVQWFRMAFCIRKGVYDKLLPWPMKQRFIFQLLHPEVPGRVVTMSFNTTLSNLEEYSKPSDPGTKYFVSQVKIETAKLEENGYIEDDTIWARLRVCVPS